MASNTLSLRPYLLSRVRFICHAGLGFHSLLAMNKEFAAILVLSGAIHRLQLQQHLLKTLYLLIYSFSYSSYLYLLLRFGISRINRLLPLFQRLSTIGIKLASKPYLPLLVLCVVLNVKSRRVLAQREHIGVDQYLSINAGPCRLLFGSLISTLDLDSVNSANLSWRTYRPWFVLISYLFHWTRSTLKYVPLGG